MTTTQPISEQLRPAKAPRLPAAHPDYRMDEQEQLLRVLRIYFAQLDNNILSLFNPNGGRFLSFPYGSFSSTQTQTPAVINTPQLVTFNLTDYANEASVTSSQIHVARSGVYNIQFSAQVINNDTQAHDMAIWLRKASGAGTAVDIPYTSSVATIPSTHGGVVGYNIVAANFYVDLIAGDHAELWWAANSTQVQLATLPPITTPFINPGSPSIVATLSFVSALPA